MSRASTSLLPVLAAVLWPVQAPAQQGPSFDCDDSDTATEFAICASPKLSQLEMQMFEAYQRLVDRIGQPEARRLADELLVPRQACEGDIACIAERLLVSMEVFNRRGLPDTETAAGEPPPAPPIEDEVATAEPLVPAPEAELHLPLAAQAPWPPEAAPIPPVRDSAEPLENAPSLAAVEPPPSEELTDVIAGAELTSSEAARAPSDEATFDTPISWAFMDLSRKERAAIQAQLAAANLYEGPAEGSWDHATLEALDAFLAGPHGQDFDASTQSGAALALDYVGSDAFAAAYGIEAATETVPIEEPAQEEETGVVEAAPAAAPDPADPPLGSEW